MKEKLESIKEIAVKEINACTNEQELLKTKSVYLGKDSEIMGVMKSMKDLSIEEKKEIGKLANEIKSMLDSLIKNKMSELAAKKENKKK